jgi:hypothetical protein
VLPAPSPSRQYARLRDMMVNACMNVASRIARPWSRLGAASRDRRSAQSGGRRRSPVDGCHADREGCRGADRWVGRNSPPGDPRGPGGISQGIGARNRPLPRRIERVRVSIASPLARPSPNGRRVGIRIVTFEACSGFTHVTARRIAQPLMRDLCHEAPALPVTRPSRSSATRSIDNSLGGISSSSDPRLRGALPTTDTCTAPISIRYFT